MFACHTIQIFSKALVACTDAFASFLKPSSLKKCSILLGFSVLVACTDKRSPSDENTASVSPKPPKPSTRLSVSARTFTFTEESGKSYECSKDGGTTPTDCSSPFSFGDNAIAKDKLCVRVKASGNTPASDWSCYNQAIAEHLAKQWSRLLGTGGIDIGFGVSVDSKGAIYVTGYSSGAFDGKTNQGSADLFLIKYDSSGNKQWSKLLGSSNFDFGWAVSVDSADNVYVSGMLAGNFDGQTNQGGRDMFLIKYDASGNKQWSKLVGTSGTDQGYGVSVDSAGNVYVTGESEGNFDGHTNSGGKDMFLVKYNTSGVKQWSKLVGTSSDDEGFGVSVDSSDNVYVTGESEGNFDGHTNSGGKDMFLIKYDSSGNKQWSKLLGSRFRDEGLGMNVDSSGNVYVTGFSAGAFDGHTHSGNEDMFLIKYDTSGNKQWSKLVGTSSGDRGKGVSVDSAGSVYVTGYSAGAFDGHTNQGSTDMFLIKYDSSGVKKRSKLLGTNATDEGLGVSVDSSDNVYVTGYSQGAFDGHTRSGDNDMLLIKFGK